MGLWGGRYFWTMVVPNSSLPFEFVVDVELV